MSKKNKKFRPQVATQTIELPKEIGNLVVTQPEVRSEPQPEVQSEPVHGRAPEQIELPEAVVAAILNITPKQGYVGNTIWINYLVGGKPCRRSFFMPGETSLKKGQIVECVITPTPQGLYYNNFKVIGEIAAQEVVLEPLLNITEESLRLEALKLLQMENPEDSLFDIFTVFELASLSVKDLCELTKKEYLGTIPVKGTLRHVARKIKE